MPHIREIVKKVDGIDILEEEPTHANILMKHPPQDVGGEAIPDGVLIQVSFHKRVVEPERVAAVYAERLAVRGLHFGKCHSAAMEYEFVGNRLYLTVQPKNVPAVDGSRFPSPQFVEQVYRAVRKESGKRLTAHGRAFEAHNLIPACIAFMLRASGGIRSQKEIHRLLNDQLFGEKRLDEYGYVNTSEVVQLRENVPKAGERIARMLPLV